MGVTPFAEWPGHDTWQSPQSLLAVSLCGGRGKKGFRSEHVAQRRNARDRPDVERMPASSPPPRTRIGRLLMRLRSTGMDM